MSTYTSLIENSDYPTALNLINSEIKTFGIKTHLIQAKVFCLINMQKFTLAISAIKMARKRDAKMKNSFELEEAYCLYRLGKFNSCLNFIEKAECNDFRMKALQGQVLYRLERFDEAAEFFEGLLDSDQFPLEELKVNFLAAKAQAGQNFEETLEPKSFDLTYNLALVKYASKEYNMVESLATDCESFSHDENVSPSDLVNSKLVSICALMKDECNLPEANFLLRKLQTSTGLTPLQDVLIKSNLMATGKAKVSVSDLDLNLIDKLSLFKSQKRQILVNAQNSGLSLSATQIKSIKPNDSNSMDVDTTNSLITLESLKDSFKPENNINYVGMRTTQSTKSIKCAKNKATSTSAKPLDKERWIPLRDRSYYKSKAQYLKSVKNLKSSSKK